MEKAVVSASILSDLLAHSGYFQIQGSPFPALLKLRAIGVLLTSASRLASAAGVGEKMVGLLR